MKQTRLIIETKTEKYPIIIGSNLTSSISKIFKSNSIGFDKCLIVVDKNDVMMIDDDVCTAHK